MHAPSAAGSTSPVDVRAPTRELSDVRFRLETAIALVVILLPSLGAVGCAVWVAFVMPPTLVDLLLFGVGYVATMLGITLSLHRYFSHRAFDAHPAVHAALAVLACTAFQGPIIRWVADHRRHHQYSDAELDPHSPGLPVEGTSFWRSLSGLWRAHIGWMFERQKTIARTYAPDLLADPVVRWFDRTYFAWGVGSLVLPGLIGLAVAQTVEGLVSGILFGGLLRVAATQHAIWAINSIGHAVGARPYRTGDTSRNLAFMSVLTLGEGWHNTHHAFPASPRVGLEPGQLDLTWWAIALLERLGLATARPTPTPEQRRRKTASPRSDA